MPTTARRPTRPTLLLSIIAVASTIGAFAAHIAHHQNVERVAQYRGDAACGAPLVAVVHGPVCSVDSATVAARWVYYFRSTPTYRVAFSMRESPRDHLRDNERPTTDSVALAGRSSNAVWNALPPGRVVLVERFRGRNEPARITAVGDASVRAVTLWNPLWRDQDTSAGRVGLGVVALLSLAALLVSRTRRRT